MSNYYKQASYYGGQNPPVQNTMKRLSQKINDMSKSQQNNYKLSEITTLQNRVHFIEQTIQQSLKTVDRTVKCHKETLIQMGQSLSEIQSRNQLCKKVRTNQIKQLQAKINNWIAMEKKSRMTFEQKIVENFQERFQVISAEFSKTIQNRKQYLNSLDQKLSDALPSLKQEIIQELQTCCIVLDELSKKLQTTTDDFKEQLKQTEQHHEGKISKVMELLTQTVSEVKKQINQEKYQRDNKKDQIMQLFEGAYKKLIL